MADIDRDKYHISRGGIFFQVLKADGTPDEQATINELMKYIAEHYPEEFNEYNYELNELT